MYVCVYIYIYMYMYIYIYMYTHICTIDLNGIAETMRF